MKKDAILAVLHIVNSTKTVFGNVKGITPITLSAMLRNAGYQQYVLYSNTDMWEALKSNTPLRLNSPWFIHLLKNTFAYGFFASKNILEGTVKLTSIEYAKFKKTSIDFSRDKALLNELGIRRLIRNYDHFIFISPHLDDAVLSCCLLLENLKEANKQVSIITVFTNATLPPYTNDALNFVNKSGYQFADLLFQARKEENIKVLKFLKLNYRHLDFTDAAFRKTKLNKKFQAKQIFPMFTPQRMFVYPNFKKLFSGKVSILDNELIKKLKVIIRKQVKELKLKKILIVAPLGIGGHVDHIIIRQLARELKFRVLFWSDFPYNTHKKLVEGFFSKEKGFEQLFTIKVPEKTEKYKVIKFYKSQIPVLFPEKKIPQISEIYYTAKDSSI